MMDIEHLVIEKEKEYWSLVLRARNELEIAELSGSELSQTIAIIQLKLIEDFWKDMNSLAELIKDQ